MTLRQRQREVEDFLEEHELEAAPGFRLLDLVSEVGELASDAAKSSDYGLSPGKLEVKQNEFGDALFSLLAAASKLGVDVEDALDEALEKYRDRIEKKGDPGSM